MSRKWAARVMGQVGLTGVSRRKGTRTTRRDPQAPPAPDRLWVADTTYVPTQAGFLYFAIVLDMFSRWVVSWSMARHHRTELVLGTLDMAVQQRRPDSVIHHSGQGCQYTSFAFRERCRKWGVTP